MPQHRQVKPGFISEVVVDRRYVRTRPCTDLADSGCLETVLGENLPGGVDQSRPRRVDWFRRCNFRKHIKHKLKTHVLFCQ
jgi:hypothetical protein